MSNFDKLKSLSILRHLTNTSNETIQWINKKQTSEIVLKSSSKETGWRTRGASLQSLDDIVLCLPASFDLNQDNLLKHFDLLKTNLNASNAKYISDAMRTISRKINDEIFLKSYLEFIRNEQFQKLGK